jgi:transposase
LPHTELPYTSVRGAVSPVGYAPAWAANLAVAGAGHGRAEHLPDWLAEAETSALSSFARGLRADERAVTAALREPWSNGQTEGQINRLKTLKRQMYGRANLDLLRARLVVGA